MTKNALFSGKIFIKLGKTRENGLKTLDFLAKHEVLTENRHADLINYSY
jgi:hypothetical protein